MKCKKQYACLHTHTTAFGLMGADTLTGSLSSLSGPLASERACVRTCLCLCVCVVCVCMCMCDPSGGSRQAPREFFNPLTESDSFTLKWESGRASLWTVCFRSIEKLQLHLSLSHTSSCLRTRTCIHTCSVTPDTWEFTLLQVTQLVFQTVGLLCPL